MRMMGVRLPSLLVAALALIFLCALAPVAAQGIDPCGGTCSVASGSYNIALPDSSAPPGGYPALLFFHGAGRSGELVMQRTQMVNAFLDAGIALIAPDGMERPDRNGSRGWFFLPDAQRPRLRDEATFTREVLDDAVVRHGIDRARVAISGYSIGGSLAWYLACAQADLAQVYLPVAGAFWRPHPQAEDCDGPIRLLHTHGWRDGTVPLEGRPLRGGTLYQGDVFEALQTLRALNGCAGLRADEYNTKGTFWRRAWTECDEGTALELALHTGGHLVPDDWAPMAIAWWQNVMDGSGADALQ